MVDQENYTDIEDAPSNIDEFDAELDEMEADLSSLDAEIQDLVDSIRSETDASLRIAVRYSGDETVPIFIRDDIDDHYSDHELATRIEALALKGLGDPPREESLYDFGRLDATIRWYDEVLVATFPYREWSGLIFSFDRADSPLVDLAAEFLRE